MQEDLKDHHKSDSSAGGDSTIPSIHVLDAPGPREVALYRASTPRLCRYQPQPTDGR